MNFKKHFSLFGSRHNLSKRTYSILFSIFFLSCAFFTYHYSINLSKTTLGLLIAGIIPFLLPFLRENFSSVEIFGLKAELLKQKILIEHQQEVINRFVLFGLSYYLFNILKSFQIAQKSKKSYFFDGTSHYRDCFSFLLHASYLKEVPDENGIGLDMFNLEEGTDLSKRLLLTENAEQYIILRTELENKK